MAYQSLQEYLDSLMEQRQALTIQIAGVRTALGLEPEDGAAALVPATVGGGASLPRRNGPPGSIRSDSFFRMSIPEAIKSYLEIMKQPQTPKAITDGLKAGGVLSESTHFYANVRTALKRLKLQGQVVNTKTGGWGLAEWYAGRAGAALADRPRKKGKGSRKKGPRGEANGSKAPSAPSGQPSAYQRFVAEQRAAGKTLKEIGPLWQRKKAGA